MKNRIIKLAVIPAVLVALLSYIFISRQTNMIQVPVAKNLIHQGEIIDDNDITFLKLPSYALPPGTVKEKEQLVGKRAGVTRVAGDFFYDDVIKSVYVQVYEDETLICVNVPEPLTRFITEGTKLIIATTSTSNSGVPPFAVENAEVVSILSKTTSNTVSSTNTRYAIVKVKRDQAVQLASSLKSGDYTVIIQKQ
ncbi:SAF domain protein [Caldicellulosiruptor acetigenus I77R1B]|uniref:SAF domain protein n=1 Tax=Caldicellulosiruptor acetigenus (strain ATCC 700853 / DSM 12137 / I77R1B) TaxID=632335 RepID=E4S5R1_CALA7|nr:SAF domain-containing protein [Caldicellulosiruptor acetigenus]ADQ41571.1 SAF domain protein [Caldicellulosiruptor acetigenus I77R1B]